MGGALGGIVRQNCTFHFSWAAWSGNCRSKKIINNENHIIQTDTCTQIHALSYQLKLHNSNTVSEDVRGSPQKFCKGI